jgi:hypothetical protein
VATSDYILARLLLTGQVAEALIFCMSFRHSFDSWELRFGGFADGRGQAVDGAYWGDSQGNGTSFLAIFRPAEGRGRCPSSISRNSRGMCTLQKGVSAAK